VAGLAATLEEEELALWRQARDLWALSAAKDVERIRQAMHPSYMGWDMTAALPHDRDAAVRSVSGDAPQLVQYDLEPLSVRVYDGCTGVVHYRYEATVAKDGERVQVSGRWTEVYVKQGARWLMVAVSGRPDQSPEEK
jgi:hypothetical protein